MVGTTLDKRKVGPREREGSLKSAHSSSHLPGLICLLKKEGLAFNSRSDGILPGSNAGTVFLFPEAHYEAFYNDFGPLNLSVLYRFCKKLQNKLNSAKRKPVIVNAGSKPQDRVNNAYLVGAFCIIHYQMSANDVWSLLKHAQPPKFIGFRDAAMGASTYDLTLLDTLKSVEKAMKFGWLNFNDFDCEEYEHYERVENGDFNWILPDKMMAFCGPHNKSITENGYPYHSPETYFEYFRENNVTTIVRLNKKMYDARRFTDNGFEHVDLFFVDGSTPNDQITLRFIDAVEKAPGAVAVHCKAGLGRTGTLIACWMMKHYDITAAECIAWTRICRPGCVIGPQQQFLLEKQEWCYSLRNAKKNHAIKLSAGLTRQKGLNNLALRVDDISLADKLRRPNTLDMNGNAVENGIIEESDEQHVEYSDPGQGDRLLIAKARRQRLSSEGDTTAFKDQGTATDKNRNNIIDGAGLVNGHACFTSPTTPVKPVRHQTGGLAGHQQQPSGGTSLLHKHVLKQQTVVRTLAFKDDMQLSPNTAAVANALITDAPKAAKMLGSSDDMARVSTSPPAPMPKRALSTTTTSGPSTSSLTLTGARTRQQPIRKSTSMIMHKSNGVSPKLRHSAAAQSKIGLQRQRTTTALPKSDVNANHINKTVSITDATESPSNYGLRSRATHKRPLNFNVGVKRFKSHASIQHPNNNNTPSARRLVAARRSK